MLYRKGFGGVTVRIICKDLSFTYEPKKKNRELVLDNISFTINEGEFFGIVGHTGSGKSTLIQHLNTLIPLQSGQLFVGDFDLSCKDKDYKKRLKDLRSKVGMVFQYPEYQLFAETVFEDVAFGLKNFFPNLSEEEVVKRTKQAIELVGLNFFEVKDKSPFDLSGGQKRRVAIAGVLVSNPEILVLDEPVAGLDPQGKRELIALLHSLMDGKRTIIIVSHDMDEVAENCSRVAVMSGGKIVKIGTAEEVFSGSETDQLGKPLVATLKGALNKVGVEFDCEYTPDSFVSATVLEYKKRKGL